MEKPDKPVNEWTPARVAEVCYQALKHPAEIRPLDRKEQTNEDKKKP
jgi:hypothetical protein